MATDLCLSISKFSKATGQKSDNTIPWNHIYGSNIFAILKGTKTYRTDGQLTLRVVQGNKVIESVDIASYIDSAAETRRRAQQAGITPQVEQLPIFGITKDALIALRYRLQDGQARRLQLKMQNSDECQQIVHAFHRRGMEFQEQRPRTGRPGTGRPDTAQSRHLTAQSTGSSPYFEAPPAAGQPSPFQASVIEAESLLQVHPNSPNRPISRTYSPFAKQEYPPQPTTSPEKLFSRDEVTAPREVSPTGPTSSQIYRSYTTSSVTPKYQASELQQESLQSFEERPSSTSHAADLDAIITAVEQDPSLGTARDYAAATSHTPYPTEHQSSGTIEPTYAARMSSDPDMPHLHSTRPSTAVPTFLPDTLEHNIPLRRELPLERPDSRPSGSNQGSSRPGTSSFSLPPLPKPKLKENIVKSTTPSPLKDISPNRPGTASPMKSSFTATNQNESTRPKTAAVLGDRNVTTYENSTNSVLAAPAPTLTPAKTTPRKRSPMQELLDRESKTARANSLIDAPHENVTPPQSTTASPQHKPTGQINAQSPSREPASRDPTTNAYNALIGSPIRRPHEASSLEDFVKQSRADREAALEEFMIANLENPAFTTLCEDVENCWRRIALGL